VASDQWSVASAYVSALSFSLKVELRSKQWSVASGQWPVLMCWHLVSN
jgi:hypothetical protein